MSSAAGVRPLGFRAPGGARSAQTADVLRRLGYRYDASLGDGMRLGMLAPDLAQIPFVWPAVDGFHYLRPEPADPSTVRTAWLGALERVARDGGLLLLVCHAFITGVDETRRAVLGDVLRAAVADERIAIHTAGEIAEMALAGHGEASRRPNDDMMS